MADRESDLDCVACGACCFGHRVRVDPEDEARLTADEVLTLTELDDEAVERRMRWRADEGCVALRVEGGRFLCSIYDRRPGVCVAYERGGRQCVEWRERRGVT
jgi:Fe-S-cluster containining protein